MQRAGTAAAAMTLGSGWMNETEAEPRKRPNLVYVFPDQYRKHAMGFLGQDPVVTPRIDAFAEESVFLPHAVSNYPVCSPYRAMLMTGQHPARNGVMANCNSSRTAVGNYLKADARCLTDALSDAGYHTGYIGKWHLDGPEPTGPGERVEWDAFTPPGPKRHSVDFWYAYGTFNDHMHPHYWTGGGGEDDRLEIDQWSPEHEADRATAFIRNEGGDYRRSDAPFALFVSMNPPHPPYHLVPDRYREPYAGRSAEQLLVRDNVDFDSENGEKARRSAADYFAMVTGVDDQFGRILDALEAEGLADETIVVFTSDHGEMMGSQGRMSKNVWYEESMNVPFLLRYPGSVRPREDDLMLGTLDIFPTLLGLMGLGDRVPDPVEGTDRSGALVEKGGDRPDAQLYLRLPPGNAAGGIRGLRTHRHTYLAGQGNQPAELFDNVEDPYQTENLAGRGSELEGRTEEQMRDALRDVRDPWAG